MNGASGPADPDSGETKALLLVAEAIRAQTREGQSKYSVHNTILLWFMLLSILCHVTQIIVMAVFLPTRIAKEVSVNQNQNVSIEPDSNSIGRMARDVLEGQNRIAKTKRAEQ